MMLIAAEPWFRYPFRSGPFTKSTAARHALTEAARPQRLDQPGHRRIDPLIDTPAAGVGVVPLDDLAGTAGERHCRDPAWHEALDLAVVEHHRVRLVAKQAGAPL